ncbi:hypothetical protein AHAS_Ahas13G0338200 [Arachis hypogaea]
MGYFSPPQNDSSHYSNSGWEYRQEIVNSEHSNPWRFASEPQIDQANHMRCCPEPQNDLCHYLHGAWAYQQECEQSSEMNFLREPQSDSHCYDNYTNYGCEGNFNDSFDCAVNTYMEDCSPWPQNDSHSEEFCNDSHCGWEENYWKDKNNPGKGKKSSSIRWMGI